MDKQKTIFLLILAGIFFLNCEYLFGGNQQSLIVQNINEQVLNCPGNRDNDITLTNIPMDMYKVDDDFEISWLPNGLECSFYYSTFPGGGEINNYTNSGIADTNLVICANYIGIGVGLYYCVIHNSQNSWTSIEFYIIIEPSDGIGMILPESGSIIEDATPTFTWNTMPGVPYYHLVLSDQPFTIEYDEDGNLIVTGLNTIWQIITSDLSAQYGITDPSGYFQYNPPPLISETEYNWLVLANFSNSPVSTSDVVSTPYEFIFFSENVLIPPTLISPEDSTLLDDDIITFEWSIVEDAMTYQIFISEIIEESGSIIYVPVWNQITTNTLIDFYAASILIASDYSWKVVATDEDGVAACSARFTFIYDIIIGTFKFFIGSPDGYGIGYANVEIDPIEGSGDNIPLTVGPSGYDYKILPIGDYLITASKDGYEPKDTIATLYEDPFPEVGNNEGDTFIPIYLNYSPCYFMGSIVDNNGELVENVNLTAVESEGEIRASSSSTGNYNLLVTPGIWTISADKEGYTFNSPVQSEIESGETVVLPNLVLTINEKDVIGNVINSSGVLLNGVTVTAIKDDITRTKTTNSSGHYEFIGLNLGEWEINAQKTGYYAPNPTTLNITATSPSPITLWDIVLTPQANIVSGNANNSVVGLEYVTITATPASGSPTTTQTDTYGNYTINLPQGNYIFTANLPNYTSQNTHQQNLTVGKTIDGIDFILTPNQSYIQGTATCGGSGLENVMVTAGENSDITDNMGTYTISVGPGTYEVTATKNGYTSSPPQTISIGAGQSIEDIDSVLSPNASVVSGTVLNLGNSIANAQIKGYKVSTGANIQPSTSNGSGDYSLNLYPGTYIIWAEKTGFICEDNLTITAGPGQNLPNNDIQLTVNEAYISGTTQSQNGNVLRNVSLYVQEVNNPANSYSSVSGVYGTYNLVVSPGVNYNITASKSGYSTAQASTSSPLDVGETFTPSPPLSLTALPSLFTGHIKSHDINGNIYPLEQATIQAVQDTTTYQTSSASNGEFSLGINHGDYEITAYKTGYFPITIDIEINPGATVDTTIFLEENFSTIQGIITDATTGEPIEDAFITANLSSGGGGATYSNETGNYTLENILPGFYYTITAYKENYETYIHTNEVIPAGATITKNAQLTPLTSIFETNVTDINSNPLTNATVSAENILTGAVNSGVTNSSGFCQLSGLSGNVEFNISVTKTNYTCPDTTILLLPDTTATIDFTMQLNNASITGSVVDDENTGLGNVVVNAISDDGYTGNTTTQPTGNFSIQNLNPNRDYVVTLTLENFTDVLPDTIPLYQPVYDTTLQMIPNDRIISGMVVDQEGNTLANVNVTAISTTASSEGNTNSNGQFSIQELAPYETYTIATNKYQQGWENTQTVFTIEDYPINPLPNNLTMLLHTSKFLGYITNEASGEPVLGALITIQAENGNTFSTTSQPDGSYSIKFLYKGYYDFSITKQSYETKIISDVFVDHRLQTTQDIELTYTAPVTISGHLIDTDNRPIDSTNINLFNQEQSLSDSTDSNGFFLFENVVPYTSTTIGTVLPSSIYDNASALLNVQAENIDTDLTIDIHSANISGTITDAFLNSPLANAEVTLYFDETGTYTEISTIVTSANGHYEFSYLYEGDYQLAVNRSNYNSADTLFALQDFESANVHIPLQRTVVNAPTAAFTPNPQSGYIPLTISFVDESSQGTYPIVQWLWNFGNGFTSTEQNPDHLYEESGNYAVTLTVSDGALENSTSTIISANAVPPTADFTATPLTGDAPMLVNFTNQSQPGTNPLKSYEWDFGDGSTSSEINPSYTYADSGSFTVSLTVSDGNLSDTKIRTEYITATAVAPTADFTSNTQSGTAPLYVSFGDQSTAGTYNIMDWEWDFGDGFQSSDNNPGHSYTEPGIYTISLTVSDGTLENTETKQDYITVEAVPPIADFTSNPMSGNAPLSVNFTELASPGTYPIVSFEWDFGDGNTSTEMNPIYTYPDSGLYTVSLTVSDGSLENTKTKTDYISVTAIPPTADFNASPRIGITPLEVTFTDESSTGTYDITNWEWDFGDGNTSANQSPTNIYTQAGNYTVTLTVSDGSLQNTETKSNYITVGAIEPPLADFNASPQTGFIPLEVAFTDESTLGNYDIINWEWDFGDGNTSTIQNPTNNYTQAGNYTVTLTVSDGSLQNTETKSNYIIVNEELPPIADFIANPVFGNAPFSSNFTDQSTPGTYSITSYLWDFGDGNTSAEINPSHTYVDSGSYTVSLTVSDGTLSDIRTRRLSDTETKEDYITVNAVPPTADFTSNPQIGYAPLEVTFSDSSEVGTYPILTWNWNFGDGSTATEQNPIHTYPDSGLYSTALIVSDGTLNDTLSKTITVNQPVPPTPAFTADPMICYCPSTVTFTDNSIPRTHPIGEWGWDFNGNGQIDSTGQGPFEYTYVDTGYYTSSLLVTDIFGFSTNTPATKNITVNEPTAPTSSFTVNPQTGFAPVTVRFIDNSVQGTHSITSWEWSFDDGTDTTYTAPIDTVTHIYQDTGVYTISLTVSDDYLNHTSTNSIVVNIGTIAGSVKNTADDLLKNAIITIYDENDNLIATDTTSFMGVFSLQNFSSDHSYSLECTKSGYQLFTHPNLIGPDSTDVSVGLTMVPNAILGTVKYENSEVEDAVVKIKDQPGNMFSTQTNEFGDFVFANVSPEYYDVWALYSDTTLVSPSQSVNLSIGQSALVNIDLELAAHIVGTITHNGMCKPGVSVYTSNIISGRIFSKVTNSFGVYDIPLPHGTYNINVILEGFTVNEPMPQIQLQQEETITLDFTLTGINNSISGSAVNSNTFVGIGNVKIVLNGTSNTGIQISDSLCAGASGTFTFLYLHDGNYTVNASHNAYYPVNPIDVALSGGVSNPPTVDFSLEPKDLTIYGTVKDTNSTPLSNAIVCAIGESGTYMDTTTSDGSYSIEVDTIGVYTLHTTKFDYYPSDSVEVELTYEQTTLQHNFMLYEIPHYASINGVVTVFDTEQSEAFTPDSAQIILTSGSGEENRFNLNQPDSLYEFNNLLIPDVFLIECFAYYLDEQYQTQIQNFEIDKEGTYNQDFNYTYSPDAVSLSGTITMNVNSRSSEPIANAEVILTNASVNFSDTVYTNQNGFYQFNNLLEDQYSLLLTAKYDNEIFTGEVPNISWTGEDLLVDYSFDYILCSIEFQITENGTKPISDVNIQIIANERNFLLITDKNGFCETDSTLHTGIYSIKLTKPSQNSRKIEKSEILANFINPLPYQLSLDSLSHYSQPKQLPLQFDPSQIEPTPASEPCEIYLLKANSYTDLVFIHYYDVTDNYFEEVMAVANDTLLLYRIPIQNQSGEIEFWFSSVSNSLGLNFTNESQPLYWELTSEGILSQQNSTITPKQATLAYNQETFFEVNVFDDMNNSLNSEVDNSGTVIWSLTDSIIGNLEQITGEKRKVKLTTPDSIIGTISGKLKARITLNGLTINLITDFIYVRDMYLYKITISGVEEANNNESYFFSVNAISDSGWAMTVPIEWDSIPAYCGVIEQQISGVLFTPNTEYIGPLALHLAATDPNYGFTVSSSKSAKVFEKLNVANLADTLHTGQNCDLTLVDSMLTSGSAKLYLTPILASPMKLVSTSSELKSSIFLINSNRSPSYFKHMPGVIFTLEQLTNLDNMCIAFWDENQLEWVNPLENNPRNDLQLFLTQIPDWHEYGVVGNSKPLGIYDLQLLPNPFTPYDQIVNNMGLQIIFKISSNISRYPKITAKIYNLNGTLIRTIVESSPMMKGNYKAGEQHSLHWDGKTDNGRLARNGRYVIQLIAEDAENREELVKTIVLIK